MKKAKDIYNFLYTWSIILKPVIMIHPSGETFFELHIIKEKILLIEKNYDL